MAWMTRSKPALILKAGSIQLRMTSYGANSKRPYEQVLFQPDIRTCRGGIIILVLWTKVSQLRYIIPGGREMNARWDAPQT